jgi:hypothetical protein
LAFFRQEAAKKTGGICAKPSINPGHFLVKIPAQVLREINNPAILCYL